MELYNTFVIIKYLQGLVKKSSFKLKIYRGIVMDLTYKKMYICIGIACEHQFYEIPFEVLFTSYIK